MPVSDEAVEALADLLPAGDWVEALHDDDYLRRRRGVLARLTTPDFELAMIGPGGFTATFSGVDAMDDAWRDWLEPFERYRVEQDPEIRRSGDAVVFFGRQEATPKGSPSPMVNEGATVVLFDDQGRINRIEFHLDQTAALRSAGLE